MKQLHLCTFDRTKVQIKKPGVCMAVVERSSKRKDHHVCDD